MVLYDPNNQKIYFVATEIEKVSEVLGTAAVVSKVQNFVFEYNGRKMIVKGMRPAKIRLEFEFDKIEELKE
jgi:hypothetical protein